MNKRHLRLKYRIMKKNNTSCTLKLIEENVKSKSYIINDLYVNNN
jgi:hypothetical protein